MTATAEKPTPVEQPARVDNRRILNTIVIEPRFKKAEAPGATKELPPDDLLNALTSDGRVLVPPFDKLVLAMLPEQSTTLQPVIQAMAQNIDGFGHHFESRVKTDDPKIDKKLLESVQAERAMLANFFKHCCADYSFTELRRRLRVDVETTGEGYIEIIRAPSTGKMVMWNHIPSYQISLGLQDLDLTQYNRKVPFIDPQGVVTLQTMPSRKRFRTYVQSRTSAVYSRGATFHRGSEIRWFKEYGDPRIIDNRTGKPVTDKQELAALPEEHKASELLHFKIYSPRTPYGLPRYIGNLITLYGDRAADEINYNTMKNNNVPSMMLTVSNGQLTQASIDRIQEYVNSQIAGNNNYSKFLIVEAEGQFEGQESGIPKIGVEKLASEQTRDQLFQEYSKNNADKVRQCFRLPPIFVGRSDDYTRSTAEASRRLADEQVFSPEREEFDNVVNQLLCELDVVYHTFMSNGPNVTDDADLINVMIAAEKSGGMTPRMARQLLADILGMDEHALPPLSEKVDPDVPFTIQIADAVKNTAQPGHQLAVKSIDLMDFEPARELAKIRQSIEQALINRRKG